MGEVAEDVRTLRDVAQNGKQIDPVTVDIEADRDVEPAVGCLVRARLPSVVARYVDEAMPEARIDLDVPALRPQFRNGELNERRPPRFALSGEAQAETGRSSEPS